MELHEIETADLDKQAKPLNEKLEMDVFSAISGKTTKIEWKEAERGLHGNTKGFSERSQSQKRKDQ